MPGNVHDTRLEFAGPGTAPRILVIGYGNPGRRDDGLGPALVARLAELRLRGVTVRSAYQLSVEYAHDIAQADIVVFADAATDVPEGLPFHIRAVLPKPDSTRFSHRLSPAALLQIAFDCFGASPQAWAVGIRLVDAESYGETLTQEAQGNLNAAVEGLRDLLSGP